MIANTIKTVLFAALLVAMILPFNGVNHAAADKLTAEEKQQIRDHLCHNAAT